MRADIEAKAREIAALVSQETESLVARFIQSYPDVALEDIEIVNQTTDSGISIRVQQRRT